MPEQANPERLTWIGPWLLGKQWESGAVGRGWLRGDGNALTLVMVVPPDARTTDY